MAKSSVQSKDSISPVDSVAENGNVPARVSFRDRLTPAFVREARATYREGGFKAVWKRYGWKLFAAFFLYYLIRDSILYILIPYLVARGLLF